MDYADYGPYGFLDKFDPYWSPNLTDIQSGRRYCYRWVWVGDWVRVGGFVLVRTHTPTDDDSVAARARVLSVGT